MNEMYRINPKSFTKSHHITEINELLDEAQKHLKFPIVYCQKCDALQEKNGDDCPHCKQPVKDIPEDLGMAEVYLNTEFTINMLRDYCWSEEESQLKLDVVRFDEFLDEDYYYNNSF